MTTLTMYHNPRCSKSRQTLALLEENNAQVDIVLYLENPPTQKALKQILSLLDVKPVDIVRTGEAIYKELHLKDADLTDAEWIKTLVENPKLIQRPIVFNDKQAVIGRPPENVLALV